MPILSTRLQIVAACLIDGQQSTGREHYWAIDGDARVYEGIGDIGVVVAGPDLEAAFDATFGTLDYHHSHPDDRALSPSDLALLTRSGVRAVWAHGVGGSSYGVELAEGVTKAAFQASLDKLHGHMDVDLIPGQSVAVTAEDFERFRDLAACEALETIGLIRCHIRLSDGMRRVFLRDIPRYIAIRTYFGSVLP